MNIETFLAQYPEIDNISSENDFNKIIFQKKEFNDLKLPEIQPEQPDEYYNHQKIIARFLMSYTLYDELLLFHSPGTGKTITAIHSIEMILRTNEFKKAIIIVPNETLVERFKHEIIFVGTNNKYMPPVEEEDRYLLPTDLYSKQFTYGKKQIRKQYYITTHERFYNQLKMLETIPNKIKSEYSNTIFVIDEAHRVANNTDWYPAYFNCLHQIENRKILLMTGTPMKNQVSEIAPLMNLILPTHLLFKLGKEFENEYIVNGMIRKERESDLEKRFLGRISYLKSKPNISYSFIGDKIQGFAYPVVRHRMSEHQQSAFLKIQPTRETFYKESLQVSLFVFEDGSFGMDGYKKNIIEKQSHHHCKMLEPLRRGSVQERLMMLGKYSMKYQSVITSILSAPNENTFVYSYFMRGSGAILFGLCLELFGFTRAYDETSVKTGNKKRYAILSDSIGTNVSSILRVFNSRENRYGELIQVLIGGKQIEEGVTFYSIQQIHVLTPTWNLSSLDQTLARGIRLKSHRYLPQQTMVKIHLHISCASDNQEIYNITTQSKIEVNHDQKLVLFNYNIATLQKDIQTILKNCKTNPSDPLSVYYIKIQNPINSEVKSKCTEYGLSTLIQQPSSTFIGVNQLEYQVKPNETIFFTPYIQSIYSNIICFYDKETPVSAGIVLKENTIMTSTSLPEWDSFIILNQEWIEKHKEKEEKEKEEKDYYINYKNKFSIPRTTYKTAKYGNAMILTFDTSFPTNQAQLMNLSTIHEYQSNRYLFSFGFEDLIRRFGNPYLYMNEFNRAFTDEEALTYAHTLQNLRFIFKYKNKYPSRYERVINEIPSILNKLTNDIRKQIVLKYNLIPDQSKTMGEFFLSRLDLEKIQMLNESIDQSNEMISPILKEVLETKNIDGLREQLSHNSFLLNTLLEISGFPKASTPYLDYFITQIDYSPYVGDALELILESSSFDSNSIAPYNSDPEYIPDNELFEKIIEYIEPYGLSFPYRTSKIIGDDLVDIGSPIFTFNSKGQPVIVGIVSNYRNGFIFPKKIFLPKEEFTKPNSTDFQLYLISQQKDYAIKRIEYLIKINAFDCALTYERNIYREIEEKDDLSKDNRECEYSDCIYRCRGFVDKYEIDKSTYQLYFKHEYLDHLILVLKDIFKRQFSITIWELLLLVENQYTEYQICEALQSIIRNSVVFTNRYGFKSYLQEYNNTFFLTTRIYDSSMDAAYYTENPVMTHSLDFIDTVEYLLYSEDEMNRQLQEIMILSEDEKKRRIPLLTPLIQEAFIENAITAKLRDKKTPLIDWILDYYKEYIHYNEQEGFHSTFLGVYRKYQPIEGEENGDYGWKTIQIDTNDSNRLKELIQTEKGIYGYINELNQFIIVNLSDVPMELREKESKKRGKNCITHKLKELVEIAQILQIPIPNNPKKGDLCGILKTWFTENGLLF